MAALALSGRVPLTYDEAGNYVDLASSGIGHVVGHYPSPNNHVAFTVMQAVLLPAAWIRSWPPLLRVPNLLFVATLLGLLVHILRRHAPLPAVDAVVAAVAVLLAAPLFTTYLFVARGYLAGSLLLMVAIAIVARGWPPMAAAGVLAVATWTVPTFGYAAPGLLAVAAWTRERRETRPPAARVVREFLLASAACALLVLLLYSPVLPEMVAQRASWRYFLPPGQFSLGIVRRLTNVPGALAGFLALGSASTLALVAGRGAEPSRRQVILLLAAAGCSFLFVTEALSLSGVAPPPFWRNFTFAPLVPPLVAALSLPALSRSGGAFVWMLLLANGALGALNLGTTFVAGRPYDYRGFMALSPTPIERALTGGEPLSQPRCPPDAQPVCRIYAAHLPGLRIGPAEKEPLPCYGGSTPPRRGLAISATVGGVRCQLCY